MSISTYFKPVTGTLAVLALALSSSGQGLHQVRTTARPQARITAKINNAVTTQLPGSHPAIADHAAIGGRLSSSAPLPHLHLLLKSSDAQIAALQQLMSEQQDKTSANYHQWLTPETFGQYFGAAQSDIDQITGWLQSQGLTVEGVSKSGRLITFSGNVGQVESAFKTQVASLQVNGVTHFSNITDLSVPDALSTVVVGITRLNDIFPEHNPGKITSKLTDAAVKKAATPNSGDGTTGSPHYVSPGDAAIIYNTTPLTSAGIDGTGQTIAVLAQSNINLSDVEQFRSMFNLPKNNPTITVVGGDPGLNTDDGEAYLDAEYAGAFATGAKVNFIVSAPNLESGGVDGSALYAVENNIGDIISLSYGGCEFNNGATSTAFWNSLWEQAAAQGQTPMVSSGDSGAAGCSSSSATSATTSGTFNGYSVNSLGSSAYNVAVGGSMFVDYGETAYWGANGDTVPFINALSYIPEAPMNQGRLTTTNLNATATGTQTSTGIFSAGGGISIYTTRPAWQTGSGIPTSTDTINAYSGTGIATGNTSNGTHRLVPDISNISAYSHDGTIFCAGNLCAVNPDGSAYNFGVVGGTSVATPVQASMQALINQKNGGRQGNILPILYSLANAQYTASTTACQATLGTAAAPTVVLPASTCNFHDIVTGSNVVPTATSGTAGVGFSAAVGFDEASGLGSMNVANVANNWSTVSLISTATTFTLSPTIGINHGATQNLTVKVAPTSGTGTPTGDVSLIAETTSPNGPRQYKLTSGAFSGTVNSAGDLNTTESQAALPAGNYNVHMHYAGDGVYAPSDSASVAVSIGKESTTLQGTTYNITTAGAVNPASTFTYGASVFLDTFVIPASDSGVASGTVTYTVTSGASTIGSVVSSVDGIGNTYFYAGQSYPGFLLKPTFNALPAGTYIIAAAYSGDTSFNSSSTSNTIIINKLTPTTTLTAPVGITSGASATFAFRFTNPSTSANPNTTVSPTGTVSFADSVNGLLGSCTISNFLCSLTTTSITGAGAHTVTAAYAGDANYATSSKTASITVGTQAATTATLTAAATAAYTVAPYNCTLQVGCPIDLKSTITSGSGTPTGTVALYEGGVYLGGGTLASGVYTLQIGTLTAGSHTITTVYSGTTSTFASSTGTATFTVAKEVPVITVAATSKSTYGTAIALGSSLVPTPSLYATQPNPPTGAVNFFVDGGSTPVASATYSFEPAGYYTFSAATSVINIPAGTHTITATYVGDANNASASASAGSTVTIAQLMPTVTLSSNATVYASGSSVTLTATIPLAASLSAPTGGVTFYDGSTSLATVTPTYSAGAGGYVAAYTATGLSSGTHALTAVLAGDSNYSAASGSLSILLTKNNVWVANGNGTVSGLTAGGGVVTPAGISGGGTAIAIDNSGNVWSLNKSGNKVAEYSSTGAVLNSGITGGGINSPTALAIDGAGYVWVTNGSGTLSVLTSAGVPVNTAAYQTSLSTPTSVNVDGSGSLWITNSGDNSVTEVIGVATPVTTPTTTAVKNSTLAAKP